VVQSSRDRDVCGGLGPGRDCRATDTASPGPILIVILACLWGYNFAVLVDGVVLPVFNMMPKTLFDRLSRPCGRFSRSALWWLVCVNAVKTKVPLNIASTLEGKHGFWMTYCMTWHDIWPIRPNLE
jgi:hypothetical protein